LPIFTSIILDKAGLKESFYFLAALNFISALCCLTYTPMIPKLENISISNRVKECFGLEVFKKKNYLIWCLATFIGMFGYLIPIVNIV
jgi:hypothetical protein